MAYPFQQPSYGPPPGLGGFPGANGAPPGMAPPPGMGPPPGMSAPPGMAPPPGVQQANMAQNSRPNGLPASFQAPPNMPNINFSAPVIRLGTGPSKTANANSGANQRSNQHMSTSGGRAALGTERGVEQQRQALRDSMMALAPPTKDEIIRTVFVGGITEGAGGDQGIERLLSAAGRLRRWDRALDADGKYCTFGFAQYEDAESLATAVELFKDIEIPVKKQLSGNNVKREKGSIKLEVGVKKEEGGGEEDTTPEIEKSKLLVFVDDNSINYLEKYQASHGDENASAAGTRLESARASLRSAIDDLFYPPTYVKTEDAEGDTMMRDMDGMEGDNVEVVNIPLPVDDELADIPAEMRETVAQEIAAFRDRSNRRDLERLRREEEFEAQERQRNGPRSRLASPPPNTPSGPAAGTNNIPLGPRERGMPNAPSGPKFQGQQIPRDYQRGVSFVNGSGTNGVSSGEDWIKREDEDSEASDEELERRRLAKRDAELEKQYLDQERRWLNRERSRTAAVQREQERDEEDRTNATREKEAMAKRLKDWNDDIQASRKTEEYYSDRSMWIRNRAAYRNREALGDKVDRENEERQRLRTIADEEQARGMADSFLSQQAEEMASNPPSVRAGGAFQQPFKLSFGAAAQKAQKQVATRRTVAEVEGLLEDEEEVDTSKRTLIPIKFDSTTGGSDPTSEERDQAIKQLAGEIPTDKDGLWKWEVKWEFVDESVITEKLRPFVEKKIVEYLGVQEQLLVEVVEDHLRKRGNPTGLVEQLEGALDEEAEVLVKKLWRMLIFFSESEKKGYS